MNRMLFALAALSLASTSPAWAKVEAIPGKEYAVSPADGPWMVCAASYTGDLAEGLAKDLVLEIRSRFDLPAFYYNRGKEQRDAQEAEWARRREQQQRELKARNLDVDIPFRSRKFRIEDQYAVLIGGYKDVDVARKALDYVKKLEPPKSVALDTQVNARPDEKGQQVVERNFVNPFARAFVSRNPTVPQDSVREKWDPILKKVNAGESYSLLKCRRPWTLAIKEFQGAAVFVEKTATPSFLENLFGGSEQLNASAMNAHNLAEAFHKMGFEAYVLHTRNSSVVTIGSFDSVNDPRMESVKRALTNLQFKTDPKGAPPGKAVPVGANHFDLFPQPLPMEVPKL